MTQLAERILASIAKADPQNPVKVNDLHIRLKGVTRGQLDAELDDLFSTNQINRCRRFKDGREWDEIWPTGITTLAARLARPSKPTQTAPQRPAPAVATPSETVAKPQEVKQMSNAEQPTKRQLAMALIAEKCCVSEAAIAQHVDVPKRNVQVVIKKDIEAGAVIKEVVDGVIYWRGKTETSASQSRAEHKTAAQQDQVEHIAQMRKQLHDQGNDLAALRMIVEAACGRLGTDAEHLLETLDQRLAAPAQIGKPIVILMADDDTADIRELKDDVDPQRHAMSLVGEDGITQAIVARLIGRAVMPEPKAAWVSA